MKLDKYVVVERQSLARLPLGLTGHGTNMARNLRSLYLSLCCFCVVL